MMIWRKISDSFGDKWSQKLGEFNEDIEISLWTFYYRYRDFFIETLEIWRKINAFSLKDKGDTCFKNYLISGNAL